MSRDMSNSHRNDVGTIEEKRKTHTFIPLLDNVDSTTYENQPSEDLESSSTFILNFLTFCNYEQ